MGIPLRQMAIMRGERDRLGEREGVVYRERVSGEKMRGEEHA